MRESVGVYLLRPGDVVDFGFPATITRQLEPSQPGCVAYEFSFDRDGVTELATFEAQRFLDCKLIAWNLEV